MKAVVLLSGGLDSATVLYHAIDKGFQTICLSFDYNQRHKIELECATELAHITKSEHRIVKIDPAMFSQTALVGTTIEVPKNREMDQSIPVTYVPARNTIFLSYALALAESYNCDAIFIGANALDYSGYPDCRPEYITAFQKMADLAIKRGVEGNSVVIQTPLIHFTKAEIIKEGLRLKLDYSLTSSCYNPRSDGRPCLQCDSCRLRQKGFDEVNAKDPLIIKFFS